MTIPLCTILKKMDEEDVLHLHGRIRALLIHSFPLDVEMTHSIASTTKEIKDREVVAEALALLMHTLCPTVYSNEPQLRAHNNKFVHGDLDLIIGEAGKETSTPGPGLGQHIVTIDGRSEIYLNTELSETKSPDGRLAAARLSKKTRKASSSSGTKSDLSTTVQPILQLILVGQLQEGNREHIICWYMNRYKVRPFIYFPAHDIMLSTDRAYVWQKHDRLMLRGCLLIAMLLSFKRFSQIPQELWDDPNIPKTGFVEMAKSASVDIKESYFLQSSFKSSQRDLDLSISEETLELHEPSTMQSYLTMKNLACNTRKFVH